MRELEEDSGIFGRGGWTNTISSRRRRKIKKGRPYFQMRSGNITHRKERKGMVINQQERKKVREDILHNRFRSFPPFGGGGADTEEVKGERKGRTGEEARIFGEGD